MFRKSWDFFRVVKAWAAYLLKARGNRWLHPPFLCAFYEVYADSPKVHKQVENWRMKLQKKTEQLSYYDPGTQQKRSIEVASLAKRALLPGPAAARLAQMVAFFGPDAILEMGTCLGTTAAYFAFANPKAQVWTLEGVEPVADLAQQGWDYAHISSIELRLGLFSETLPQVLHDWKVDQKQSVVVYIDGHHQFEPTLAYWKMLQDSKLPISAVVFDDIRWSVGMWEAWNEMKREHPNDVWLDLGRQGWWISGKDKTPGTWTWRRPFFR